MSELLAWQTAQPLRTDPAPWRCLSSDGRVCPCRHAYHVLLIMGELPAFYGAWLSQIAADHCIRPSLGSSTGFQARGDAWRYNLDSLLSFKVCAAVTAHKGC